MYKTYCIGFCTLLHAEIRRIFRIWTQAFIPSVISTLLYFVIFGEVMGARIGAIHGIPYVAFIAPGLVIMNVITNAYSNVASSFFIMRFQHSIEEILVSPLPLMLMMAAYVLAGITRAFITGGLVLLISCYFTTFSIAYPWIVLITALLTASLFSLAGFTNALFARNFDDTMTISTFILTPMTYLGGIFYSISFLPEIWQYLSSYNPVFHMVNLMRYGFLGISDIAIAPGLWLLIIANITLCLFNWNMLKKGKKIRE